MQQIREVHLKSRPDGTPTIDNFSLETVTLKDPAENEVQVRNTWMSVDPYMRPRMLERDSYVKPFEIGQVLEGGALGRVVRSNDERFHEGDLVLSNKGWREAFNAPGGALTKIDDRNAPDEAFLGIAGMPGLTAYTGVTAILNVQPGEVVFVSAASGAVGSAACQFAKLKGAYVVGTAGGRDKCDFLREIGVDQVIDYKATDDFTGALKKAAPRGLDCYFDNVGGAQLDSAMEAAKPFARFALCGMVSQYNGKGGLPGDFFNAIRNRLMLRGFLVSDHGNLRPEFLRFVTDGISTGKLKWRQTVEHGLDQAPGAFIKLFSGENFGKMLVKLD